MPLVTVLHATYVEFMKSISSKSGAPTAASLTPQAPAKYQHFTANTDADSVIQEGDGDDMFYDAEDFGKVDPTTLECPPSIIFDTESVSQRSTVSTLTVPALERDNETRISEVAKRDKNHTSIKSVLTGHDAEDIVDALYKTSFLGGHISSRLISQNRFSSVCTLEPSFHDEPEFSDALPGGVPAVRQLWELFSRTLLHGIAALSFTLVNGGYLSSRFQADAVVRSVAALTWFQELFAVVESGPLGQHFTHWNKAPVWDFRSPITPTSGFVYWFCLQIAVTLGEIQSVILCILHHFARETAQKYDTAGYTMSNCEEEGPYTIAEEATRILRLTGCIGEGHGKNKKPADDNLLVILHISSTVEKLTNRALLLIGHKNIAMGADIYHSGPFRLPYTCMALASAIMEIEYRVLRNLPLYYGEFIEPFTGSFNPRQEAILEKHRQYLDLRNNRMFFDPGLAAVRKKIRKAFRIKNLGSKEAK